MDAPKRPPRDMEAFPDGACRLILIGKTGCGKSATGNTILGRHKFLSQVGINSQTEICDIGSTERDNLLITVMDTPGLADTQGRDEVIAQLITRSLLAVHPGPHAILLCIRCDDRFTDIEYNVYQTLKEIFGENMTSYLIVIFVGADKFKEGINDFEQQLKSSKSDKLRNLLSEAGNRYMLFNNRADKAEKENQVRQLLLEVKKISSQNGGQCFKHKVSSEVRITWDNIIEEELKQVTTVKRPFRPAPPPPPGPPRRQGQGQGSQAEASEETARKGMEELSVADQGSPLVAIGEYSIPDRPGMTLADKQVMVGNVLRKVVLHPEELNEQQKKDLDDASKTIGQRVKEGMKKLATSTLEQCSLM